MLFLVLVLCPVNGFLMMDLIYILTMGGPGYDTTTISWLGFQTTFKFFKFGPGTAILYTLTGLCLLMTLLYHRLILSGFEAEASHDDRAGAAAPRPPAAPRGAPPPPPRPS